MSISAKQVKQILDNSFTEGSDFLPPAISFVASPSVYSNLAVPSSVNLNVQITANQATNISWTIYNSSSIALTTGSSLSSVFTVLVPPSSIGVFPYTLQVTYQNNSGVTITTSTIANISVLESGFRGQFLSPTTNITTAADLTSELLEELTPALQTNFINLFGINATETGRICFVIPNSFGIVLDISDNTDSSVLNSFNIINDVVNNRKIYTTINALTPNNYFYRLHF
jgi:hypothetical protein